MNNQSYSQQITDITIQMYFYSSVILIPIGILLNIFEFIIFQSKEFKKANFGFLMSLHVLLKSFSLSYSIIIYKYLPLIGFNLNTYSNISCFLFVYTARVIQQLPIYIQTFISFTSYLNITYHSKFISLNKKFKLLICIALISIIIAILNMPNAFRTLIISNQTNLTCVASQTMNTVSVTLTAFLRCIIPFLMNVVLNVLTLKSLIKPRNVLNFPIENEIKFGYTLTILSLIFLVFNLPLFCLQIVYIIYLYIYSFDNNSSTMITISFLYDCSRLLAWSYYSIGVFIDLLANQIFRQNFISFIKKLMN